MAPPVLQETVGMIENRRIKVVTIIMGYSFLRKCVCDNKARSASTYVLLAKKCILWFLYAPGVFITLRIFVIAIEMLNKAASKHFVVFSVLDRPVSRLTLRAGILPSKSDAVCF